MKSQTQERIKQMFTADFFVATLLKTRVKPVLWTELQVGI